MRLLRSIAMHTDHDFYGKQIETSRVDAFVSGDVEWAPKMLEVLKRNQEQKLRAMAKRMPHHYWINKAKP